VHAALEVFERCRSYHRRKALRVQHVDVARPAAGGPKLASFAASGDSRVSDVNGIVPRP
jgi:hypothetical protein